MHYAYIYRDSGGEPYYVGKGTGNRSARYNQRNWLVRKRLKLDGPPNVEIIEALNEEHAKFLETCLIAVIGRQDLGNGPLLNLTDGGDGRSSWSEEQKALHALKMTGQKRSQEVREKMSKAAKLRIERNGPPDGKLKGKPSKLKGRKLSPEHKLKISRSLEGHEVSIQTRDKMSSSHRKS